MASQTGKKKIDLGGMPRRVRIKVKMGSTHKHEQYRLKLKGCVFTVLGKDAGNEFGF